MAVSKLDFHNGGRRGFLFYNQLTTATAFHVHHTWDVNQLWNLYLSTAFACIWNNSYRLHIQMSHLCTAYRFEIPLHDGRYRQRRRQILERVLEKGCHDTHQICFNTFAIHFYFVLKNRKHKEDAVLKEAHNCYESKS